MWSPNKLWRSTTPYLTFGTSLFLQSSELGPPPHPHQQASVSLLPFVRGGGGAWERGGVPIRTRGQTLWYSIGIYYELFCTDNHICKKAFASSNGHQCFYLKTDSTALLIFWRRLLFCLNSRFCLQIALKVAVLLHNFGHFFFSSFLWVR